MKEKIDISFFKILIHLQNIRFVCLLIFGIILFDSLEIFTYKYGIIDTDFSTFINLSIIPFLLLFLVVFGIIFSGISFIIDVLVYKICNLFSKEYKRSIKDKVKIYSLNEIALIKENSFLIKYISDECNSIKNMRSLSYSIYSMLFAIVINLILAYIYKINTIIKYIINIYNDDVFIVTLKIILFIPILLVIVIGIRYSFTRDQFEIYFPETRFNILKRESESTLNQHN